ncbi:MAG: PAS domain S-box protein [Solirubrobacteraceae bacterium]
MTDPPAAAAAVDTYAFLSSVLAGIAQPVWVVDPAGDIRFTNPAAIAALGYDDAAELDGKPSHQTIHYKHRDGTPYPVAECSMLRPRQTGETIHIDEDWFVRRDGTMFPVEYWSAPIDTPAGRGAVVAFTDIEERRRLAQMTRERDIAEARATEARAGQRRIIEAGDAARARLARDLHDGAQQQFLNTLLHLRRAEQKWTTEPEQANELVGRAIAEAQTGIEGLRELAAGIHPAILTTRGLAAALYVLAGRLPYRLELELAQVQLPPAVEASVYFFCSEALTNVTKHARAEAARVTTVMDDGHLTIQVSDNGVGGPGTHAAGGLAALTDRVAALDGTLEVTRTSSRGTTLTARLPLTP